MGEDVDGEDDDDTRTPPDFRELQQAEAALLAQRLRTARAAFPMHQYEKGASLEHVARSFIKSFLPGEYGLGTGFVVWREKTAEGPVVRTSGQLDLIIYDALRSGPVADLGSAAVYPIEGVFGYVEVKATIRDNLRSTLLQSKELRDIEHRLFTTPLQPADALRSSISEHNAAGDYWWTATDAPQLRPLSFVFAFEYERNPPKRSRTDPEIVEHFEEAWRDVGHLSHLSGVLVGESGFLRYIPDSSGTRPFKARLERAMPSAAFKSWMLRDLARGFRMPQGWSISPDGLWEPPGFLTETTDE